MLCPIAPADADKKTASVMHTFKDLQCLSKDMDEKSIE
jgi:hypothetical protein